MSEIPTIPAAVLDRYSVMLINNGAFLAADDGDRKDFGHLLWMLDQIRTGVVTDHKAHRWLGFVQGILIANHLTTVDVERDFTRPFFQSQP